MKTKLLIGSMAVVMLTSFAASARVNLDVDVGVPVAPVYAAPVYAPPPAPVYYPGYIAPHPYVVGYDPYHRGRDWRYWHDRHEWEAHHHR